MRTIKRRAFVKEFLAAFLAPVAVIKAAGVARPNPTDISPLQQMVKDGKFEKVKAVDSLSWWTRCIVKKEVSLIELKAVREWNIIGGTVEIGCNIINRSTGFIYYVSDIDSYDDIAYLIQIGSGL